MDVIIRPGSPDRIAEAIAIDDDACTLYESAGLRFDIGPDHPFARQEHGRWTRAAEQGLLFLASRGEGPPVGLLVLGFVDCQPHLDQLSVRTEAMRQGIGTRLLSVAIDWAAGRPLWLETYAHLPWNQPFYERLGFAVVAASDAPADVRAHLEDQRRWLPAPEQRVAMCRR
jgi:GNAT superfamily N-acetyltransferase